MHLWGRVEHAEAFGRLVQVRFDPAEFHVIEVYFDPRASVPCYNDSQDGIGPAYFADEAALGLVASVREVRAVPRFESERDR